jgi:hypothetical protein
VLEEKNEAFFGIFQKSTQVLKNICHKRVFLCRIRHYGLTARASSDIMNIYGTYSVKDGGVTNTMEGFYDYQSQPERDVCEQIAWGDTG